ncbi:uncharacterized protein LOC143490857 isoform X2 [Brachyhypopomus gauderio]|uniref:uncharacterized protein LOC143490857 isoform X2 n=1 Tax=Brachyhypopomus gauderio TaxID=698409 RepID=UPI004041A505
MSVHKTPPTLVVFLLSISEVVTQYGWAVIYSYESKCVLKGSTVAMGCTYQYPDDYVIRKTFWSTKQVISNVEPPDLSLDPEYRDRIQFLGDTQSNCTLRLRNVTENDTRQYYFRFLTTTDHGKFQDLQVETPETVLEGEDVTLTCNTTCSLSQPKYTWYKNGVSLSTTTSLASNKHLLLKTISKNDVNSYSCGVLGQSHQSSAVTLDVRYPPKNVSVSISPSGEIVEGSSITLTCSSDANPPAKYTWFKGHTSFSGGIYTIANISSEDSKEYKCKYFNKYGTKYLTVPLNVLYPPKNVSVSISPSGEIVEASLVTLTCNSDANPPVQNYTWFREGGTSPVGSGQSYIIYDSGLYYCVVQNKYGIQRSAVVPVTLKARFSMIFYVILGVCLIVATILLSGVFWTSVTERRAVYRERMPGYATRAPKGKRKSRRHHGSSPVRRQEVPVTEQTMKQDPFCAYMLCAAQETDDAEMAEHFRQTAVRVWEERHPHASLELPPMAVGSSTREEDSATLPVFPEEEETGEPFLVGAGAFALTPPEDEFGETDSPSKEEDETYPPSEYSESTVDYGEAEGENEDTSSSLQPQVLHRATRCGGRRQSSPVHLLGSYCLLRGGRGSQPPSIRLFIALYERGRERGGGQRLGTFREHRAPQGGSPVPLSSERHGLFPLPDPEESMSLGRSVSESEEEMEMSGGEMRASPGTQRVPGVASGPRWVRHAPLEPPRTPVGVRHKARTPVASRGRTGAPRGRLPGARPAGVPSLSIPLCLPNFLFPFVPLVFHVPVCVLVPLFNVFSPVFPGRVC